MHCSQDVTRPVWRCLSSAGETQLPAALSNIQCNTENGYTGWRTDAADGSAVVAAHEDAQVNELLAAQAQLLREAHIKTTDVYGLVFKVGVYSQAVGLQVPVAGRVKVGWRTPREE